MGRRQGGTEGSVREDPKGSGSWRARLPARLDPSRKAIAGSFSSATEARRALNEAIADIDRGRAAKPTPQRRQPTRRLAQVITEYTADRANDGLDPIAVNTIRDYHELLKNVVGKGPDNLGLRPVKDIDSPLLNAWLRDLHRLGHSHARVTKAYALVRAALAWEVRQGRLAFNPAREVRRVSTKSGRGRRATVDPVLLPSWKELALLAAHPERRGGPSADPAHGLGRTSLERSSGPIRQRRVAHPTASQRAPSIHVEHERWRLDHRRGQGRERRRRPPPNPTVVRPPRPRGVSHRRGSHRRRPAVQARPGLATV